MASLGDDLADGLLAVAVHATPGPALLVDAQSQVLEVNEAASEVLGGLEPLTLDDLDQSQWSVRPLDHSGTRFVWTQRDAPALAPGAPGIGDEEDVRDHLLRQFFGTDGVMFVVAESGGSVLQGNEEWTQLAGPGDGINLWHLAIEDKSDPMEEIQLSLRLRASCQAKLRLQNSEGSGRDTEWSLTLDHKTGLLYGIGRDVTAQLEMTAQLESLAYHDSLTGLANRTRLVDAIERNLASGNTPGVLFCDLDRFKVVNDSLGHQAGDDLLKMLAKRLTELCDADSRADELLVGRLGGDEFVILMRNTTEDGAARLATAVLDAMSEPFVLNTRRFRIGMSVGIAVAADPQTTRADLLLGEADTAAYNAKDSKRGGFVIHDSNLQAMLDHRFDVEAGLIRALDEGRFEVHYQPIVRIPSGEVSSVEALVRWRDDDGTLRQPADFVGIAEDAGLIGDIGDLVLRAATTECARLSRPGRPIGLAVNATAGQISTPSYVDTIRAALRESEIPPDRLTLELTESAMLSDMDSTIPVLEEIRAMGIRIAVDDFGTGYSSLSYLRELPIDIVKIDRSFVETLATDHVSQSVVSAVLSLADALALQVVMEGVETEAQLHVAATLGCKLIQGYLFHRPMPIDQLTQTVVSV